MSFYSTQNLKYVPDMKDPRDFIYREGDFKGIMINKKHTLHKFFQSFTLNHGLTMILDTILLKNPRLLKILQNIDLNKLEFACRMKYGQLTYRALFQFLRNYLYSSLITEGKPNFIYWRVREENIPLALQNNVIFTGFPVYEDCVSYSTETNEFDFKIPSHNNSIMGYANFLILSCDETEMIGKVIVTDENNNQRYVDARVPRYIFSSCEPIYWCIQFDILWYKPSEDEKINDYIYEYEIDYYHHLRLGSS